MNLLERSKLEERIQCYDTIDRREREKVMTSSMVYKELGQKA